jgi:serine/threonine protein phosphatase PrpC
MTDTQKVRFNNSTLVPELNKDAAVNAAANAAVVADPNAGAPATGAEVSPVKAKKALEALAKESPNPNAKPEDPTTDPAAAAKAANEMDNKSSASAEQKETAAK